MLQNFPGKPVRTAQGEGFVLGKKLISKESKKEKKTPVVLLVKKYTGEVIEVTLEEISKDPDALQDTDDGEEANVPLFEKKEGAATEPGLIEEGESSKTKKETPLSGWLGWLRPSQYLWKDENDGPGDEFEEPIDYDLVDRINKGIFSTHPRLEPRITFHQYTSEDSQNSEDVPEHLEV